MTEAAEKFVREKNIAERAESAQPNTLEHQITVNETAILKGVKKISEDIDKMINSGDYTPQKITKETMKAFEDWDRKAKRAVEQAETRAAKFDDSFTVPDANDLSVTMLAQKFEALSAAEQRQWTLEARTGDTEKALFFLHAPRAITGIDDDLFERIADTFRDDAAREKSARRRNLLDRAKAVRETWQHERRRFING
jgi:hypothetical protein